MLDATDRRIIELLRANARMQWQEIGDQVHLTGQAVRNRIDRLERLGVLEGYTVRVNADKLGMGVSAYVTVFMKTTDHRGFGQFVRECSLVREADRISGEGCYLLQVLAADQPALLAFLDELLAFGNYRVNLSLERLK